MSGFFKNASVFAIFFLISYSSDVFAAFIPVGTKAMDAFFKDQGITYVRTHAFVESLSRNIEDTELTGAEVKREIGKDKSLPGWSLLLFHNPKTLEKNSVVLEVLKIRDLIGIEQIPKRLEASIRDIPKIRGFGLYAERDFEAGEILGFYGGEVVYPPPAREQVLTPPWFSKLKPVPVFPGMASSPIRGLFFGQSSLNFSDWENGNGYFVPYLDRFLQVDSNPLAVDARAIGNETRFINHAEEDKKNCDYVGALMNYAEFLDLSGIDPEDFGTVLKQFLIPVVVVTTQYPVKKGSQFLANYGEGYWTAMRRLVGLSPIDLSE